MYVFYSSSKSRWSSLSCTPLLGFTVPLGRFDLAGFWPITYSGMTRFELLNVAPPLSSEVLSIGSITSM